MNLKLTDEQHEALIRELREIVHNDRYPFSPRIVTLKGDPWAATAGARTRAPAHATTLRAAEQGQVWETARLAVAHAGVSLPNPIR